MKQTVNNLALAGILVCLPLVGTGLANTTPEQERLAQQVRHELLMLPFFGVFDDLSFTLEGRTVVLSGQVTRPVLASSAAQVVKGIRGVEEVVNRIEVLPLSPMDDRIRLAVYRTLFRQPSLSRYTLGAIPPVRILVKNGNVTLTGVVLNEMDRNIAGIQANLVSGVFSVTNNLRVEGKS